MGESEERLLGIYVSYWKDDKLHEMEIARFSLRSLDLLMKYGSQWQDRLDLGPFDVSEIQSLDIRIRKIDGLAERVDAVHRKLAE